MTIRILKDGLHRKNGRVKKRIKCFILEAWSAEGAGRWNSDWKI
jgi:hypothetical protein